MQIIYRNGFEYYWELTAGVDLGGCMVVPRVEILKGKIQGVHKKKFLPSYKIYKSEIS